MNTDTDRPFPAAAIPESPPVRWVRLEEIFDAETFRLREVEAESVLAESLIRHGQTQPVDLRSLPQGLQLINGHRRLAAVRLLRRERVLGRVYEGITDEEAVFIALADDLDRRPWSHTERSALRERLEARGGSLPSKLAALLERADAQAPVTDTEEQPGSLEEEIDADLLAASVRDRLADACNDLHSLHEQWADLDEGRRADLVECVAYLRDMYPFLAASEGEDP